MRTAGGVRRIFAITGFTTRFAVVVVATLLAACVQKHRSPGDVWAKYDVGEITFEDKAVGTRGSEIYHGLISDPEAYIAGRAREVLSILYESPQDSVQTVRRIHYTLEDTDGISAKGGGHGRVHIFYSSRYVENRYNEEGGDKILFETRGVLLHELTHAYQLEPRGIGTYGDNRVFWAFIEGMADAVRVAGGGFPGPESRPMGGRYMDGYRTTGYFLVWLRDNKDPGFLWKFNRSALEVVPWSFDGAIKHILGEDNDVDTLWHEYQVAMGDISEEKS
jgi:hypothetical protein